MTKAMLNAGGRSQFITYTEAPTAFKVVDYCQEGNSFFGCIVMVCQLGRMQLVENYHFHKMNGFQIVGCSPGTTRLPLESRHQYDIILLRRLSMDPNASFEFTAELDLRHSRVQQRIGTDYFDGVEGEYYDEEDDDASNTK